MAEIKLTKNEMRSQQKKLGQLRKYLPTLQLKKAMLQAEVADAHAEIESFEERFQEALDTVDGYSSLFSVRIPVNIHDGVKIAELKVGRENIAGVEVPAFESIAFETIPYNLFDTPPWLDSVILGLHALSEAQIRLKIAREKKAALESELRMVSIRVNLFEKILIPRALKNIKKIKVFLGDQELAAVSRAKAAKNKIELAKGKKL